MPFTTQEWIAAAIVMIAALLLLRAQWKKSAEQLSSSCNDCHKQTEIGKPKQEFRGIKVKVAARK
jgi:hypothetical protein